MPPLPSPPLPQDAHRQLSGVVVPGVRADLTARRVMTMEWMEGERPSDLMAAARGGEEGAKNKLLRLVLQPTGVFFGFFSWVFFGFFFGVFFKVFFMGRMHAGLRI